MPNRRITQRALAKPSVAFKKKITLRGITISLLALSLVMLVGPLLTINIFSPIYAAAATQKISNSCLALPSIEISVDILAEQLISTKCKKVFVWTSDHELLRSWTSTLESRLSQIEFIPDFASTTERYWCKSIAAGGQQEVSAFGLRTEIIKLAYACEASGVALNSKILADGSIFTQYRHGLDFWGLIWSVNLQA